MKIPYPAGGAFLLEIGAPLDKKLTTALYAQMSQSGCHHIFKEGFKKTAELEWGWADAENFLRHIDGFVQNASTKIQELEAQEIRLKNWGFIKETSDRIEDEAGHQHLEEDKYGTVIHALIGTGPWFHKKNQIVQPGQTVLISDGQRAHHFNNGDRNKATVHGMSPCAGPRLLFFFTFEPV
jgi:hypothetical protein